MLISLHVQNIAVIRDLSINFGSGLNVITGETGAGKSIVIDSLNFVLGDRADKSLIRYGQDLAVVQACFECTGNDRLIDILNQNGIEIDDGLLIIRRTMNQAGRSDCKVNGWSVTLSQLKKIVSLLVDIHSQHQTQSLLNEQTHINILDSFSDKTLNTKKLFVEQFSHYKSLIKELENYPPVNELNKEIDMISYQIEDINSAQLKNGEEEQLVQERNKLQNNERIIESTNNIISLFKGGEILGIEQALSVIMKELKYIEKFDESIAIIKNRVESVLIEVEDLKDFFNDYLYNNANSFDNLESIERRIDEIRKIKRKYGNDISKILEYKESLVERLNFLINAEEKLEILNKKLDVAKSSLLNNVKILNEQRLVTGRNLSKEIESQLIDLGMKYAKFFTEICFIGNDVENINNNGGDNVRFQISLNAGEPLKPLAKVASGGEMSRIMLAIKNITAELENINTLIFDEIDTGISGLAAKIVAQKLSNISVKHQVIVVTHLAQIAAMADNNYLITKNTYESETISEIQKLNYNETIFELMRMLGSESKSEIGFENAKELKNLANTYKLSNKRN